MSFTCKYCYTTVEKWMYSCPKCHIAGAFGIKPININKTNDIPELTFADIKEDNTESIPTGIDILDDFLYGGLPRATIIVFGQPGSGKTTLFLQILSNMANNSYNVYLQELEEPLSRMKKRLKFMFLNKWDKIHLINDEFVEDTLEVAKIKKPDVICIDSLNKLSSKINKRMSKLKILEYNLEMATEMSMKYNVCTICIMHQTKTGLLSGTARIEHLADTIIKINKRVEKLSIGSTVNVISIDGTGKNRYGFKYEKCELIWTPKGFISY